MRFWDVGVAIFEGVISIPVDLYYGGRRTLEDIGVFGEEVAAENARERERVFKLVQSALRDPKVLERVVRVIVEDFVSRLPDSTIDKINEKLKLRGIEFLSRQGTKFVLSGYLALQITQRIITKQVAKRAAKLGVGLAVSAVLLQGMLERASNASHRLKVLNPKIYNALKKQDLDMIYFMVEETLAPLIEFSAVDSQNPREFQILIEKLEASFS